MTKNVAPRRWVCLLAAVTATAALAAPASAQPQHAGTQEVLDRYRAKAGPGAAIFAGDRAASWNLSSGTANIGSPNLPIRPADHFRAASQTKTFTAAVVLQLVDEGVVQLDAPIEQYLPGVVTGNGYDGTEITVRQILQQTSGIASPPITAYVKPTNPDGTFTLRDLVRIGLGTPPLFEPGTSWAYSNVNYHIAGLLIEQLTGEPAAEAITSRIIGPLGLAETRFPAPGDKSLETPYVPGYTGGRVGPFFFWTETTFGIPVVLEIDIASLASTAGAVLSTMEDLAKFYRALFDGQVVSAGSLAEMRRTVPIPGGLPGYGYGLALVRQPLSCGGNAWGHPGDLATGHSSLTAVTDGGRHASMVTNTMSSATNPLREDLIDAALCETG
ncbi:serine hydrolase domain-containing protein [Amycolatopsis magusensis]|uniref:serine hydrolase domain-containing protein n=1 Tax=Amycolatopsis magusensis TaxID=882444 RepID=UPI003C2FDF2A